MTLLIEQPVPRASLLANWEARWKLAGLSMLLFALALLRVWWVALFGLAVAMVLARLARLGSHWVSNRLLVLALALLPFLVVLPLTLAGEGPTWKMFGVSWSLHGIQVTLTLLFRAVAITLVGLVLLSATPFHDLLAAAQKLWVPALLMQLTLLSYRYVFLMVDELERLRVAVRVRAFRNRAQRHAYRTVARVMGALLVRSHARAERVSQAMQCRGFAGQFHTLTKFHTRRADVLGFLLLAMLAVGLVCLDLVVRD